jgi:hypothetical protein
MAASLAPSQGRAQGQQQQQRPRRVGAPPADEQTKTPTPRGTPSRTPTGEEVDEDDVVRVETQLVSVPAVVTDREGKPLTGLRADNFLVFEDGRPQKIANFSTTEAPFEVALLLDTSGSTRQDVGLIRRAALAFVEALRPGDRVAVLSFSTRQEDKDTRLAAVERIKRAGLVAYFVQVNTESFVEDRLMADCEDGGGLRLSRAQLQRYRRLFASRADAADFSNFCQMGPFERMHISRTLYRLAREEMNSLARDTGGNTFPVADLRDARRAFRQVAEEIGTQYSLGYYSSNTSRDGSFRTIRVQVRGVKDAQVRAREGYQAPKG